MRSWVTLQVTLQVSTPVSTYVPRPIEQIWGRCLSPVRYRANLANMRRLRPDSKSLISLEWFPLRSEAGTADGRTYPKRVILKRENLDRRRWEASFTPHPQMFRLPSRRRLSYLTHVRLLLTHMTLLPRRATLLSTQVTFLPSPRLSY